MSHEIAVAMIGATTTIFAAALPPAFSALSNRRSRHLSARRDAFLGRWEGTGTDFYVEDSSKPKTTFTLTVTFTAVGRTVKADGVLRQASSSKGDDLSLSGTFYNDDYVQLSFYNKSLVKKQLGVVVVGLSPDGMIQRGYYTGFSPERSTIIAGAVSLERKP